jgi:pyruvate,orthophosphate dikinase
MSATEDIEDTRPNVDDLKEMVRRFKALVKERTGRNSRTARSSSGAVGAVFVPG